MYMRLHRHGSEQSAPLFKPEASFESSMWTVYAACHVFNVYKQSLDVRRRKDCRDVGRPEYHSREPQLLPLKTLQEYLEELEGDSMCIWPQWWGKPKPYYAGSSRKY